MALPEFSMRQLLKLARILDTRPTAGTRRWIATSSAKVQHPHSRPVATVPLLHAALVKVREVAAAAGACRLLAPSAKRPITSKRRRSAQYFINQRWLGGTLTNWQTVSKSIARRVSSIRSSMAALSASQRRKCST